MRAAGLSFFGPSAAAAELEASKAFAKRLMADAGVPTAAFGVFEDVAAAEEFIDAQPGPVVVKADGLCAGKGVVVAATKEESRAAVRRMLGDGEFGAAGARVVLEERLFGREVSMMALCDGERLALLPSAEDHKAVFDGDQGPNTGGMGTYSPSALLNAALTRDIVDTHLPPHHGRHARAGPPLPGRAVRRADADARSRPDGHRMELPLWRSRDPGDHAAAAGRPVSLAAGGRHRPLAWSSLRESPTPPSAWYWPRRTIRGRRG